MWVASHESTTKLNGATGCGNLPKRQGGTSSAIWTDADVDKNHPQTPKIEKDLHAETM